MCIIKDSGDECDDTGISSLIVLPDVASVPEVCDSSKPMKFIQAKFGKFPSFKHNTMAIVSSCLA